MSEYHSFSLTSTNFKKPKKSASTSTVSSRKPDFHYHTFSYEKEPRNNSPYNQPIQLIEPSAHHQKTAQGQSWSNQNNHQLTNAQQFSLSVDNNNNNNRENFTNKAEGSTMEQQQVTEAPAPYLLFDLLPFEPGNSLMKDQESAPLFSFSSSSSSTLNHGESNLKVNNQNLSYFNQIEIENTNQPRENTQLTNDRNKEHSHSFMSSISQNTPLTLNLQQRLQYDAAFSPPSSPSSISPTSTVTPACGISNPSPLGDISQFQAPLNSTNQSTTENNMSNHQNSRPFHTHIHSFPSSDPPFQPEKKQLNSSKVTDQSFSQFQAQSASTLNQPGFQTRINPPPSSRMMQGAADAAKMKPAIQNYLKSEDPIAAGERTVIIMTSKVAQKSYGTERRFLCPPPSITLVGMNWWTPVIISNQYTSQEKAILRDNYGITRAPPLLAICISGESSDQQQGRIEWYNRSGTLVGQTGSLDSTAAQSSQSNVLTSEVAKSNTTSKLAATEDWYQNKSRQPLAGGRCVLKRLFINDADEKRKRVECLVKVQLANGLMLGTLSSRAIKVISKPSKKRQSVKNVDLCIYHGTTISLFNRVRSQTVSTRYLGVSSASRESASFDYPGSTKGCTDSDADTCFVAKTDNWDSFIIWRIDSTKRDSIDSTGTGNEAAEYIGCPSMVPTIPYPNPPTIALKNRTKQPLAIRYNQHIVLQCLTTGLVSPVMIIRKVDRASTVVGGARSSDNIDSSFTGGGEFGDEVLGDPVSQLHKVALQIITPGNRPSSQYHESNNFYYQQNQYNTGQHNQKYDMNRMPEMVNGSATYLACLNDLVGTHKTTNSRIPIKRTPDVPTYNSNSMLPPSLTTSLSPENLNMAHKRRLSMMEDQSFGYNFQEPTLFGDIESDGAGFRRRVSSLNDIQIHPSSPINSTQQYKNNKKTSGALGQKVGYNTNSDQLLAELGAYWCEDVNDASVWTLVGTECAKYTFWTPSYLDNPNSPQEPLITAPLSTPFPCLIHFSISSETASKKNLKLYRSQDTHIDNENDRDEKTLTMTVTGENFTRDLQIWFGDVKAPLTDYRSREMLVCRLPPRNLLLESTGLERINSIYEDNSANYRIRILLVRGDGVVYKTSRYYSFV